MDHIPDLRNRARGEAGEDLAAAWYSAHGYLVVERNWRTKEGEIDLLCAKPDWTVLVVCEVKARRTDRMGVPAEAVTRTKRQRLRRLAAAYLQTSPHHFEAVRFDVAAILGSTLTVIEGAF
jgi:putative endonuclease